MFYLPSKDECDYIVENSKQFFLKEFKFQGKEIVIYHYKQGNFEEFERFNAYELRALTFVKEGKWKRFLGIHKFFELNQAPGWMKDELKNKKIIKVQEKIDGTFVHPILVGGKVYFKSKLRFDSYQAKRAQEIFENNENLKQYVIKKFNEGKIPLFEYFSPRTQVVMDYKEEKLVLIQVRDLETGKYDLDFENEAKDYGINTAKTYKVRSLDEFIDLSKTQKDIEGWVLIFEDMQFVKIKTDEYLRRHKLLGKIQPHEVIKAILEKRENEYKEILNKKSEKYEYFAEIENKFLEKYESLKKEAKKAVKLTKKEFKKIYSSHPYYELLALCKNKGIEEFDGWVKKHTSRLKGANRFLEI